MSQQNYRDILIANKELSSTKTVEHTFTMTTSWMSYESLLVPVAKLLRISGVFQRPFSTEAMRSTARGLVIGQRVTT